jgi:hypothetical protein
MMHLLGLQSQSKQLKLQALSTQTELVDVEFERAEAAEAEVLEQDRYLLHEERSPTQHKKCLIL